MFAVSMLSNLRKNMYSVQLELLLPFFSRMHLTKYGSEGISDSPLK